jgi:hypothetical protein
MYQASPIQGIILGTQDMSVKKQAKVPASLLSTEPSNKAGHSGMQLSPSYLGG